MLGRWIGFVFVGLIWLNPAWTQDTLLLTEIPLNGTSIANQFHLYTSPSNISVQEFLVNADVKKSKRPIKQSVENLDFTASSYFIDFVVVNTNKAARKFVLQTARPVTNEVVLWSEDTVLRTGDEMVFADRAMIYKESAFPIALEAGESKRFVLKIRSDGEALIIPMRFWNESDFVATQSEQQFYSGIYFGIFLFVVVIYFIFYTQLRDRLFLSYTMYIFLSGLLQFSLDGYMYRYVFPSGSYWVDHLVVVIAGGAVFFLLKYASRYLGLKKKQLFVAKVLKVLVLITISLSLIPGGWIQIGYPAINVFSLLSVIYLLVVAIQIRRTNSEISFLFMLGMSTLLIGVIVFIVGNAGIINAPDITQNGLKAGALVETICLSILMAGKYRKLQEEKEQAQAQLLVELEEKNMLISESNVRLEIEVKERTKEIESQREELKEKNEDLVASIKYAQRLQRALLTDKEKFFEVFPDAFVLFRPRDLVSGDFFWAERILPNGIWKKGLDVFAVADCTGHGVPGAFVSIVCNNLLKMAATNSSVNYPGEALDLIDSELQLILNSNRAGEIKDGMDISLCAIDPDSGRLFFAGARNSLLIVRKGEQIELKADKRSVGYREDLEGKFTTLEFKLQDGDMIYAFTDGFPDQFGGPFGKKFLSKKLREMLTEKAELPLVELEDELSREFESWKGSYEQVDDVLVAGVRFNS
jgi:two-component system, sensor histidine kinase LadS